MKLPHFIALLAFALSHLAALATESIDPYPKVTTSEDGTAFFKMVPAKYRDNGTKLTALPWERSQKAAPAGKRIGNEPKVLTEREPYGVAYRLGKNGEIIELWRTKGWYDFTFHISNDGQYLARIGDWGRDHKEHADLAIAFYHRGALLKEYRVKDLIKDPAALEDINNRYQWIPSVQTEPTGFRYFGTLPGLPGLAGEDEGIRFHLVMIDKTDYTFDARTGNIVETGIDKDARSETEYSKELDEKARKLVEQARQKAEALYRANPLKAAFDSLFTITRMEPFGGDVWSATLTPKKSDLQTCHVKVTFPMVGDNFATALTPERILAAVASCLHHPYVQSQLDFGATGIRITVEKDALHPADQKTGKCLRTVFGKELTDAEMAPWAYAVIESSVQQLPPIFVNVDTGQLIMEEANLTRTPPRTYVLLDASGDRVSAVEKP
jgi:hypothetical protein